MNVLFTADIIIKGQSTGYNVFFEHEEYHFTPEDETAGAPSFSLCREHDEWKVKGDLEPIAGQQATAQLESYLLSQH